MNKLIIIFTFLVFTKQLFPQEQFTEQTSIELTGVGLGSVAWGDYDNDGDLDILLTGDPYPFWPLYPRVSKIYRNNGDNTFTDQTSIILIGISFGSGVWGDYDNDGDLDILLTGRTDNGDISKIYRNNGDNTFVEQSSIALAYVDQASAAWGDYDNDGDLDILLTGINYTGALSRIYRNNGDNTFTEQTSITLTGVQNGSIASGDYDNDGNIDILLTGYSSTFGHISKIYRNNGDNTFAEQTSIELAGVFAGSAVWGDYDSDGDLDILLNGHTGINRVSKIYRNNGDNTFTDQTSIVLAGISRGSVAWGDYDNDGDLDILMSGSGISKIYRNSGDNTFTDQTSIELIYVDEASVAWGDYDNDGDLDILLTGTQNNLGISKIYRNNNITPNTLPNAPSNLSSIVSGEGVTLSWDKSTDNKTPQNGLRYNLVISTLPNEVNTLSPMSDRRTGYRRVINLGNANLNNSLTIQGLDLGQTYYWSVQAIDNCFAGSEFAPEQSILITSVEENNSVLSSFLLNQNYPNPFNPSTSIQYRISSTSQVSMKVYDVLGNEVATLVNEEKPAGSYEVKFSATGLSSGIYFYKLQAGSLVETKKMLLMK